MMLLFSPLWLLGSQVLGRGFSPYPVVGSATGYSTACCMHLQVIPPWGLQGRWLHDIHPPTASMSLYLKSERCSTLFNE